MSSSTPSDVSSDLSADTELKRRARELFRGLPARYDVLSALLSFGQDPRWRRAMVQAVAPVAGERVLDVATGTGLVAGLLSERGCSVVGIDQSPEMLAGARRRFADAGDRVELIEGQAEALPFASESFDALTFTYLLRYVEDPQATLAELARVVKPGGTVASLEFCVPPGPLWRAAWEVYTRAILPAGGLLLGGEPWLRVGRFLGPNITGHYRRYPVPWTVEAWQRAGFTAVGTRLMSLGGGLVLWGQRSGA
jgi:demethylmenaquinone methyltransferase/2-methoxy-6-polyprenyl-1,4-benzoquinol methylase